MRLREPFAMIPRERGVRYKLGVKFVIYNVGLCFFTAGVTWKLSLLDALARMSLEEICISQALCMECDQKSSKCSESPKAL